MFSLWTYKFDFTLATGEVCDVHFKTGLTGMQSTLFVNGETCASDETRITMSLGPEVTRQHSLPCVLASGAELHVSVGYVTSLKAGIVATLDGETVFESHSGRSLDKLSALGEKWTEERAQALGSGQTDVYAPSQKAKFKRNWPSLAVDIGLGFVFFFVAKYTDLTTAAIWGAVAGLGLVVVQQFVKKVDLLGGLALFGIVMMMISAASALVLQDEYLIQMRTTVMGVLGATLYLADGFILKGRYLGERTARYMFIPDIVPQRLSLALGAMSLLMAILNYGVVRLVSKDIWLYYTTFGDFLVAVLLFSLAIRWVTVHGYDAQQAGVDNTTALAQGDQ